MSESKDNRWHMINIGLFGAGHLGNIHLRLIQELDDFHLVGVCDQDEGVRQRIAETYGVETFADPAELMARVDAVDLVVPTLSHAELATMALMAGKHVFIEKPVTHTVPEAEALLRLSQAQPQLKVQVGHVERFNPALLAIDASNLRPMFIEGHRLAVYNPRGTDVSVILDLMIHDLDVVLSLVPAEVAHISASGVAVISDSPDIANARIEFANGCVANLTASRISIKNMRRLRLFQRDTYLAVDFLKKKTERLQLTDDPADLVPGLMQFPLANGDKTRYLRFEQPEVQEVNAIKLELAEFARSIMNDAPIRVPLADGVRALRVAHQILHTIEAGLQAVGES
jgi:predicted dehydrogenase